MNASLDFTSVASSTILSGTSGELFLKRAMQNSNRHRPRILHACVGLFGQGGGPNHRKDRGGIDEVC